MTGDKKGVPAMVELPRAALIGALTRGEPVRGSYIRDVCPSGVMGSLVEMPLTEILQSMDWGKKTARIEVWFDEQTTGVVHVYDGQIVRADASTEAGQWTGELAFVELCRKSGGAFRIEYTRVDIERNVQRPTTFVLLEALRVLDEERAGAGGEANADPAALPWDDDPFGTPSETHGAFDDPSAIDIVVEHEPVLQQHPRHRLEPPRAIEIGDAGGLLAASLEDIGLGGAFIATALTPSRGARVRVRLPTATGMLELDARVVHVLDAKAAASVSRSAGVGVSFEELSAADAQRLRALVDEVAGTGARDEARTPESDRERLLRCLAESEFLVAAGDLASASRVLQQAHGLAPGDDDVRRRLMKVNEAIDAAQANALLERALRGAPNAVDLARRATELRPVRDVLLRSLGVFARAGVQDEIADVAEQLLELDPNDEGALRTLHDANAAMQRWSVAVRAAEGLVRLHPDDEQLKALLQKAVAQARKK